MSTKKACSPVTHNPQEDAFYERIDPRPMPPDQLAQIAYEAWRNKMWWGDRGDNQAPRWSELSKNPRDAWLAAAQAVKANVLGDFTKVGEGEAP